MNIVVPKKDFLRILERCHPVADKKSAVPALANVLLTAEGRTLRVAATDLYLAMSGHVESEVSSPGSIALPARDLFERVKAMPDGPIHLTTEDGRATIKAVGQARRYTLHGLPGSDFPALPTPAPGSPSIEIPVDVFARLMARTHFSISTDETRAHVNSALFEWSGDRVRMVATDGHRLSKMEAVVAGTNHVASMLIPLKAIGELRRMADAAKGQTLAIQQHGPCAFFNMDGVQFSVKLIDAQFPPYQQVIPSAVTHSVRVPRVRFADALKAMQLAADDRTGGILVTLAPGALTITATSPESGNAFDQVDVDYAGAECKVGMNAKYLLDVLAAIDDEEAVWGVSGELDPITLRPATESAATDYLAVVMPLRI